MWSLLVYQKIISYGQIQEYVDIFENWKFKISSKLWWLELYIWYQIKWPIIIFHLKGHAVKLKCVNYKIFWKNMIFAKKWLFKAWKYT